MRSALLISLFFLLPLTPTFALPHQRRELLASISAEAPKTLANAAGKKPAYLSPSDAAKELQASPLANPDTYAHVPDRSPPALKADRDGEPSVAERVKSTFQIEMEAIRSAGQGRKWARELRDLDARAVEFLLRQRAELRAFDSKQSDEHVEFTRRRRYGVPRAESMPSFEKAQAAAREHFVQTQSRDTEAFVKRFLEERARLRALAGRTEFWENLRKGEWNKLDG